MGNVTERELKSLMPDWPSTLIRDYISFKRNLVTTANLEDSIELIVLNNAQEVGGYSVDIGKLSSTIATQNKKIKSSQQLIADLVSDSGKMLVILGMANKEIKANNQLIADLLNDNGKLVAKLNQTDKKIKNINQLQADF